jgi:hypothetical protein
VSAREKADRIRAALAQHGIAYEKDPYKDWLWRVDRCPACGGPGRLSEVGEDAVYRCDGECDGSDLPALQVLGIPREWDLPPPLLGAGGYDPEKFRKVDVAAALSRPPEPVPWVIDGFAAASDVTILTADPGVGKSMLLLGLCSALARGERLGGLACTRGSALYLDAENGRREIARRLHGLGCSADGLIVIEADGVNLREDLDGLAAVVAEHRPTLLVLDSLTALCPGMNERKTEQVAPVLYGLKRVAGKTGAAIVLLHHRPKSGGEYRGTTAIAAAAQIGFTLDRAQDDPDRTRRVVRCWKCRPAPEPEDRWLALDNEREMVLISQAAPFVAPRSPETTPARPRDRLAPRVLEVLEGRARLRLVDIARKLGLDPKDASLRRVLDDLEASGEICRGADKKYERCQVPGADTPKANGTLTPDTSPHSAEPDPGFDHASEAELDEADRVLAKFPSFDEVPT